MTLHLAGALLAGSIWLLAVVLAWPAGSPIAAVVLLAPQAVLYAAVAIGDAATDAPSSRVRIRRRPR
jgi:hypothetical protein